MEISQMVQTDPRLGKLFSEARGKGYGSGMWFNYFYEQFIQRVNELVGSYAYGNKLNDKEAHDAYKAAREHLENTLRAQPEQPATLPRDPQKQNIAEPAKPAEPLSFVGRVFDSELALKEARRLVGIHRIYKGQKAAAKADLEALLEQAEDLDAEFGRELDPARWRDLSDQRADLQREIEYTRIVAKLDPNTELLKIPNDLEQRFRKAAKEYHAFYREYRAKLEELKRQYEAEVEAAHELAQKHPYWQASMLKADLGI